MKAPATTSARRVARAIRSALLSFAYAGQGRFCPVCECARRRFQSFGAPRRPEARCVGCGALERHRLVWLYLVRRTDLFDGREKRMLHVAPEPCFERRLRARVGPGYVTGDMHDPAAMVRLDITEIDFPDESFDVVYCSHVLEHVPDDRKALAEIRRVLKPDGWAILLVPIDAAETIEDPSITDPGERLRLFGQGDHVRRYGPDYVERLHQAGFDVAVTSPPQLATPVEIASMGLTPASGEIFHCSCQPRHA